MGLSWISCGDVAATMMTSPRVWKNNYCAKPPRGHAFFFQMQCTPSLIFINLCRRRCLRASEFKQLSQDVTRVSVLMTLGFVPQATKKASCVDLSSYCKVNEVLKGLIMISNVFSIMSQDFNLTANITLQQPQAVKMCFSHFLCYMRAIIKQSSGNEK